MRKHPLFAACVAFAIWCTLAACDEMTLHDEPSATADRRQTAIRSFKP